MADDGHLGMTALPRATLASAGVSCSFLGSGGSEPMELSSHISSRSRKLHMYAQSAPVKKICKSVNIWRRYGQKFGGKFFLTRGV